MTIRQIGQQQTLPGDLEFEDPTQQYEGIFGGGIAPYRMCSDNVNYGPIWSRAPARTGNSLDEPT